MSCSLGNQLENYFYEVIYRKNKKSSLSLIIIRDLESS